MQIKKYPHKNLNKNKILYFQIGLFITLIILLISVEWKSYAKPKSENKVQYKQVDFEEMVEIKLPENKPEVKVKSEPKTYEEPQVPNEIEEQLIVDPVIEEPLTKFEPDAVFMKIKPPVDEPIKDVLWISVQDVPIFPGCEIYKDNAERKVCMQKKLAHFIGQHFDTGLTSELGLYGKHVIYTKFKISHTGEVIFMGGQNPNPKLIEEAERVINKLPKLIPGKQRDKPVNVIFGLPIDFTVQE